METPEYENHKIMIFWDIANTLIDYQASERTTILHVLQQEGIRADEEAVKFWRDIFLDLFRLFRRNLSMEQAIHMFINIKRFWRIAGRCLKTSCLV